MSAARPIPLPEPPRGFRYYRSRRDLSNSSDVLAYQHILLRAWDEMRLSGVLTLNGIPTVYLRDEEKPLSPRVAADVHRQFWNQGIASILLLRDPQMVRVFSSMTKPVNPAIATEADIEDRLVEKLKLAALASWAERFYVQLGTGHYYSGTRESKFNPEEAVDAYLLSNLAVVRDTLVDQGGLAPQFAHAFLGRLLFTCYLCDRGIIELSDYFEGQRWSHLHQLLADVDDPITALYDILYPALQRDFNGSMFDDELGEEHRLIRPAHFDVVRRFLAGDNIAKGRGQRSLGFWAYDFKFIPVETISSIYEKFLEKEDDKGKHAAGAFYTPRFLAEMALDLALGSVSPLYLDTRRFIDPACGSGIFLVLLFSRMAAEWRAAQVIEPTPQVRAEALLSRLDTLRGVDKNLTACRITCFSLYLAFLDQFDPPGIRAYKLHTGKKLPNLLHRKGSRRPEHAVVVEGDFLEVAPKWQQQFDLIVGNPPWSGRGTKQLAQEFMEKAPGLLRDSGRACLLLPSKVFLNQTDAFQSRWLRQVTLEKVIQLADYRRILFKEARCPCNIALFSAQAPNEGTHEIEYVTPKVSCADLRDGVISISPRDRKWIPLRIILAAAEQQSAGVAWKSYLWGTPRDLKLLGYLFSYPRLSELAGSVEAWLAGKCRWRTGVGFKPRTSKVETPKALKWDGRDRVVSPSSIAGVPALPKALTDELGSYLRDKGYPIDELGRAPAEEIFTPPLVLWNVGFTCAAFFDYKVRYQHALHSISGLEEDADYLRLLASLLRSPLARYFVFHTAASLATERDQVHNSEALRLPFFLPESDVASPDAIRICRSIAAQMRRFSKDMEDSAQTLLKRMKDSGRDRLFDDDEIESAVRQKRDRWFEGQRQKAEKLQSNMNELLYKYFGISDAERWLIEDTVEIFDRSDTPASMEAARSIPTLEPLDSIGLARYATALTGTLNGWAMGSLRVAAGGGVDAELGIGLLELRQTRKLQAFQTYDISKILATALARLQDANLERWGHLEFRRSGLIFDGPRAYLLKRAVRGEWTRTAALNDAAELNAHIASARRQASLR